MKKLGWEPQTCPRACKGRAGREPTRTPPWDPPVPHASPAVQTLRSRRSGLLRPPGVCFSNCLVLPALQDLPFISATPSPAPVAKAPAWDLCPGGLCEGGGGGKWKGAITHPHPWNHRGNAAGLQGPNFHMTGPRQNSSSVGTGLQC